MTGALHKKGPAKGGPAVGGASPRAADRRSRSATVVQMKPAASRRSTNASRPDMVPIGKADTKTLTRTSHLVSRKVEDEDEEKLPIHHPYFVWSIYAAILINALQMGLQVDLNGGAWDVLWKILDHIFTTVFLAEMVTKIYYLRWHYFEDKWNVLDFFIAWSSIFDSWIIPLATGGGGGVVLKMFQFLRLLRMVKVLRMRRDLLALVEGILSSMKSMFWVSLLLLLVIYTAAILCVDMVGNDRFKDEYKDNGYDNVYYFGTLRRAMLSLFSISILDNWSSIVTPVSEVQPYMLPFFLLFLVMTSFGLMNALIGIIVEQTTAATAKIEAEDEERRRGQQLDQVQQLIKIVSDIDESNDGMISIEEMENAKDNQDLKRILTSIDLPPGFSVTDLHLMLDENGNGTMSQEDFIDGMFQLIFCNEFQNQCVAKLSVAQIKKCVFELRQDMFEEIKIMRQQITAMQKVILGEDSVGTPAPDAGSSQDANKHRFMESRATEEQNQAKTKKKKLQRSKSKIGGDISTSSVDSAAKIAPDMAHTENPLEVLEVPQPTLDGDPADDSASPEAGTAPKGKPPKSNSLGSLADDGSGNADDDNQAKAPLLES